MTILVGIGLIAIIALVMLIGVVSDMSDYLSDPDGYGGGKK
jgi:hypothetical protein